MIEKILHLSPPLTHLDFYEFFDYSDNNEETTQYGWKILLALSTFTKTTLIYLNLGSNYILW